MTKTRSERIVSALKQLQQFHSVLQNPELDCVTHMLSGVCVSPVADPDNLDHGILELTFPGGAPFEVAGDSYLDLQIIQDSHLILDSHQDGGSKVAKQGEQTSEHLRRKHGLD